MKELVHQVQAISRRFQDQIDGITHPLDDLFGVNAHLYYRIDTQGGLITLCNHPEIQEYYFENNMYKNNPFLKHPKHVPSGFLLTSGVNHDDFRETQGHMDDKFEMSNLLLFFENEGDVVHLHGFLTTHKKYSLTNVYINNKEKFQTYCRFFREQTSHLQNKLEDIKVDYAKIAGPQFYLPEKTIPIINVEKQAEFFHRLNKYSGLKIYEPLTNRELECLQLLLQGKSASLVADELLITKRTVEHHFDHIKAKLMCANKSEVFTFVSKLKKWGGDLSLLQQPWPSGRTE